MSVSTSNLDELPISSDNSGDIVQNVQPINPQNIENIKIENYGQQLSKEQNAGVVNNTPPIDFTQTLTNQLKLAGEAGATVLPSRDIPLTTIHQQNDPSIQPNYIENKKSEDYIGNIIDQQKVLIQKSKDEIKSQNLEVLYNQIQIPVLVGILFFLFQLPIVRKFLFKFLPSLYNKDGNPNLPGYIFNSIIFGLLFFIMVKILEYLQDNI